MANNRLLVTSSYRLPSMSWDPNRQQLCSEPFMLWSAKLDLGKVAMFSRMECSMCLSSKARRAGKLHLT